MENDFNEDLELEKIKLAKEQNEKEMSLKKQEIEVVNNTDIMKIVQTEEQALLETKELKDISRKFGEERIKADLASEASKIREKNMKTAETVFDVETREKRLEHLKAELDLDHKYRMETLKEENIHKQMLDNRKKLVEKYGYLYDMGKDNCIEKYDSKNETYYCPKDFSFSKFVNKIRKFGRDLSKLDKPVIQTIKWLIIFGVGFAAYFLFKKFNIL